MRTFKIENIKNDLKLFGINTEPTEQSLNIDYNTSVERLVTYCREVTADNHILFEQALDLMDYEPEKAKNIFIALLDEYVLGVEVIANGDDLSDEMTDQGLIEYMVYDVYNINGEWFNIRDLRHDLANDVAEFFEDTKRSREFFLAYEIEIDALLSGEYGDEVEIEPINITDGTIHAISSSIVRYVLELINEDVTNEY